MRFLRGIGANGQGEQLRFPDTATHQPSPRALTVSRVPFAPERDSRRQSFQFTRPERIVPRASQVESIVRREDRQERREFSPSFTQGITRPDRAQTVTSVAEPSRRDFAPPSATDKPASRPSRLPESVQVGRPVPRPPALTSTLPSASRSVARASSVSAIGPSRQVSPSGTSPIQQTAWKQRPPRVPDRPLTVTDLGGA